MRILNRGSVVDAVDCEGQTSLIEAAAQNNVQILKILLNKGAKIDVVDKFQKSAIFWAAENNALNVLQVSTYIQYTSIRKTLCLKPFSANEIYIRTQKCPEARRTS